MYVLSCPCLFLWDPLVLLQWQRKKIVRNSLSFPHLPCDPFWAYSSAMWCYENRKGTSVPIFPFNRASRIQFVQKDLVNIFFQKLRLLDLLKLLSRERSSNSDFFVECDCYLHELILIKKFKPNYYHI